ncbi:MAG: PAS domain S-box protein [Cytophagaceae bacterium]
MPSSMFAARNTKEDRFLTVLHLFRIVFAVCIVFPVFFKAFFAHSLPYLKDPWEGRILLSLLSFLFFGATFYAPLFKKFLHINFVLPVLYCIYLVYLLSCNGFHFAFLAEFIVVLLITGVVYYKKVYLAAYLGLVTLSFSISSIIYLEDMRTALLYSGLVSFFSIILLVFFNEKVRIDSRVFIREQLFNTVFNGSPDALFLLNIEDFTVTACNNRAVSMFNAVGHDELVGKDFNQFLKYPYTEKTWHGIKKQLDETSYLTNEVEFLTIQSKPFLGSQAVSEIFSNEEQVLLVRVSDLTEKLQDKKTVEDHHNMLLQVINLLPHQVYLKDNKGKYLLANQAMMDSFDEIPGGFIGKTDYDLYPEPEAKKISIQELDVILKGRTRLFPEEVVLNGSGEERIMNTVKMPLYLNGKDEYCLLGISMDVTESKVAEKAIKESEQKYKIVIEQASDGMYTCNADGEIQEANGKACEIFGYNQEEFLQLNIRDLVDLESYSNREVEENKLIDKHPVMLERNCRRKDGVKIVVEISANFLEDGRRMAIVRDITERKKYEQLHLENELRFKALIENSFDVVCIFSEDLKFTYVSSTCKRILGYEPESLIGKLPFELVHPSDIDLTSKAFHAVLETPGKNYPVDVLRVRNSTNSYMYFEVIGVNLLSDPVVNGIVVHLHDITKRVQTEKELLNSNFELDSFVYKASHDLKAPLRSLTGLIKLAKLESGNDKSLINYFQMMQKSISSLDTFIRDLTQFSRNSRMEILPEKINFEELVNEVLNNLKFAENADKIKIRKEINCEMNFYSDHTRIGTIINNLLSNAYKYHRFENNNPYINIVINTDFEQVEIIVEDNGQGIEAIYLERIFEMFFRASENAYGSGLGLYIVKSAVTKLNGKIHVDSIVDQGSKFLIRIPNLINDLQYNDREQIS